MSGFAMSKFGIRALAQSLAREFGPKGVHVSHAVIDGLIDTDKTKEFLKDVPDAKISPEWVSKTSFLTNLANGRPRSPSPTGSFTLNLALPLLMS